MASFVFDLGKTETTPSSKPVNLYSWLKEVFVLRKMDHPVGYSMLVIICMLLGGLIANQGWQMGAVLLFAIIIAPVIFVAVFQIRFGLFLILAIGFFLPVMKRLIPSLPIAVLIDLVLVSMLFGILVQQVHKRDWSLLRNPISWGILLWLAYNVFELTNPWMPSVQAWIYTMRSTAGYFLLFFAGLYGLTRWRHVRALVNFWLVLATLGALYGLFQEVFGLRQFETSWVSSRLVRFEQLYLEGTFRKFSFFSDPAIFGLVMASSSLLSIGMIFEKQQSKTRRVLLGIATALMLTAMLFSGTRTGFIVLPLGFGLLVILTLKRDIALLGVLGAVIWLALSFIPFSHPSLQRMQEVFDPATTASFQSRLDDQSFARPFIQQHPIGVGLGTTGERGQLFSPHTILSQFPPKSGFVQIGIEMGWIGLVVYLAFLGLILVVGVRNYFRTRREDPKLYIATFTAILFMLIISNYPQQPLLAPPTNLIFILAMTMLVRIRQLTGERQAPK